MTSLKFIHACFPSYPLIDGISSKTWAFFDCFRDWRGHDGRSQLRSLPWWGKLRIQTSDGVKQPFLSIQPIKPKSIDDMFWVSPQTTTSFQSGHLLKAWSKQSEAMSMVNESILLSQLVVSFRLVTLRSVSSQGPDMSSMVSMPRCLRFQRWLVKAWSIHSITGIIPDHTGSLEELDPLGDPKHSESSTDWHSRYVPKKMRPWHDDPKRKIVCQTRFRVPCLLLDAFVSFQ